jgi:hypothetical protein
MSIIGRVIAAINSVSGENENLESVTHDGRTSLYIAAGFGNTQSVHMDISTNSASIAYMLIDLSDTTNWKHTNTGQIIIKYIAVMADPASNFLGDIRIGFLKNVDGTNGDFHDIFNINMARKSDLTIRNFNFGSDALHCTDTQHFGTVVADSILFQTDTNLGGPDDSTTLAYPSSDGDLVMIVSGDGANLIDVSITIGYETVT